MGTTTGRARTAGARRVGVGAGARAHLPDADYEDAFRVPAPGVHPAEDWARRTLEAGSPAVGRAFRRVAWTAALGMRLGPVRAPGYVAGWAIAADGPGTVVLRPASRMVEARMVFDADAEHATMTLLLRFDRPAARRVWAVEGIAHRALAPIVLAGAARSLARRS